MLPANPFTAKKELFAVAAMFTAAGLNLEEFLELKDANALKSHLDSLQPTTLSAAHPEVAALIEAAIAPLNLKIESLGSLSQQLTAGLESAGIKVKAADETKGVQAADFTKALNERILIGAQEELAKHGLAKFPDEQPGTGASKSTGIKGYKTKTFAEFSAMSAAEKMEFSAKGGRIED